MTTKQLLLENINSLFPQNQGYDSIEHAVNDNPRMVLLELIDVVCNVCDRLNNEDIFR